jgi:hypothetical protein
MARPGYLARVRFRFDERHDVPLVPVSAVLTGSAGEESAFIVEDGQALRREVETGLVSGGRVEIVSGLTPGEIVVVEGGTTLREGAAVRTVGAPAAAEATADSVPGARPGS